MLECKVNCDFINSSPGSFVGDVQTIFSKDFYQSNTVAIVCDEVLIAVP